MQLTKGDRIPIGRASVSSLSVQEPTAKSDRRASLDAGLVAHAINQFRRRHPELAHWSQERIIEQVRANKDQSAVARRQGTKTGVGRGKFGKMTYE